MTRLDEPDSPGPSQPVPLPVESPPPGDRGQRPLWRRLARSPAAAAWSFPVAVLALMAVLGLLRLSGSSLGIYTMSIGATADEADVVVGAPRAIRSDEWFVRTPWVLRQAELGLPQEVASGVGTHDVAVLSDLPVAGWEAVLRPHTMSYAFLDQERAFAVEWWAFAAVQLLGVYALLLALTRRPLVAALAASGLTFSPATQWWWAPATFTAIGYGSLATALVVFAARAASGRARALLAAAAGWAAAAFLTTLYVPWQIGAALVLAPVAAGAAVQFVVQHPDRRAAVRALAVVLAVTAGVSGTLFGAFALSHRDTFAAVAGTVYPGKEPANKGGTVNLTTLWGSALDHFASERSSATVNGLNQSENSSGLVLLLPVAVTCFALAAAGRLRDHPTAYPLLGCLAGGAVIASWMLLPVPGWLGQLALLTRAPPSRMYLPLGFASVVALALFVGHRLETGVKPRAWIVAVATGVFAAAQAWAAGQYRVETDPIDLTTAALFILVVSVGVALALGPRPVAGLAVLALFTLTQAVAVNPVQRGTAPLTDSPLRRAIDRVSGDARDDTGWVSFASHAGVEGTLTASGVNHLTSVSPYPDDDAWQVLDPTSANRDVWNRYAHVTFLIGPPGTAPRFALLGPDHLTVEVDPCGRELAALGVGFFVTRGSELACAPAVASVPFEDGRLVIHRRAER